MNNELPSAAKNPDIYNHAKKLSQIIIGGFLALKKHLEEKLKQDRINDADRHNGEKNRINYVSDNDDDPNSDLESALSKETLYHFNSTCRQWNRFN